ncbi:acyl-CoA dehydrogenase family protein [Thiomicrorhabdus lithotrophica]|uniref:Acyl-CoA dehydrogenase C-terminal domain-containing protein n=1 Tax=Thiomicrorhabdus lithotrophica TaxID=2949997 RepID=A0ABY8CA03_9GAMM|nr:hypothetical protein [Thiomicrorhabdus lithotrophica]WEJ61642.1 hypothetical protein NR989_06395 [Thiomicrorhabdus lithotrophica]
MSQLPSSELLLQKVQSILSIIREEAEASEQLGRLRDDVLEAIIEHRLFRLFIPEKYRGEPTDLPTALKVFELVASADGATGWLVMIGAGGGLFSGFMEEQIAYEIFSPERAVIAGSGMPSGKAKTVKNGYEVSGRWAYASGSNYATWFTANCRFNAKDDTKDDEIRAIAVPANQVIKHDTWSVFGMRATGSHDFSVESVSVPNRYTFSLAEEPILDDPIFFCPLETLASLSFASVAVGITQHAVEEFIAFAKKKQIKASTKFLIDAVDIQQLCEQSEQFIIEARSQLYDRAEQVWLGVKQRKKLPEDIIEQTNENAIEMVQNCVKTVDALKAHSGMMAVFTSSYFGRAWRDLHTLSQHTIVAAKNEL